MKHTIFTLFFGMLNISSLLMAQVWEEQDPGFPYLGIIYDVFVPNETDAWTVGWELDSAGIGTEVNFSLSRTTNSGQTWEFVNFPHTEPGYFSCVSALSGDVAWIAYVDYAEGNKVLKTTDGGQNWTIQPVFVNSWVNTVHFFDAQIGVVLGDPDSLGFEIYTTSDGGDNWQRSEPKSIPSPLTDEIGYSGYYEVVGSEIWFETGAGRVYHSPDYGHTWSVFDGPLPTVHFCVAVDDQRNVYMAYTDSPNPDGSDPTTRLFRSSDNGVSWEEISSEVSEWWIWDIEPVPGTNTIVGSFNAGFGTGVFETRISYDRGDTWTTIDNEAAVLSIDFSDSNTGFAGKWQQPDDLSPSTLYSYNGSPLTGLFDPKRLDIQLHVSPNPTTDFIDISMTADAPEDYVILLNDLSGRLITKCQFIAVSDIHHRLEMKSLVSGTYMLTITSEHGVLTEKIVRQ